MTTGINFTLTGIGNFRQELNNLINLGKQYDQVYKQLTATTKTFQQVAGKSFGSGGGTNTRGLTNASSSAGLVGLEKSIIRTEIAGDKLSKRFNELALRSGLAGDRFDKFTGNILENKRAVDELEKELSQLQSQTKVTVREQVVFGEKIKDVGKGVRITNKELDALEKELRDVGKESKISGQSIETTRKSFDGLFSSTVDLSRRLGFIGFQFTALGSIFGGALALSAREAIEFESSITSVIQRLDRSDPLFASFKDSISGDIRKLGTDAFIDGNINVLSGLENSQNQLAQISALGSQLGVPIKNLQEFTKVIGEFSIANQELTGEEAATFMARFSNIVFPEGATTEQFRGLANDLVFLSNTMAATAPEIANQALRLAAIGSQIGFTPAETLGLSGVLASIGVKPEAGGTATIQLFDKIFESISGINTITLSGAQRSASATNDLNKKLLERQELTLEIATAEERLSRTKLPALFKKREFDVVQQRAELEALNAEINALQGNISSIVSQGTVSVTNASDEAKFLSNLLGISPQALADLFRTSPAEGTTALIQAFGTAQNRDELIGWLAELGITGTRAKQVIAGLSEAGFLLEEVFTDANEAFEDTTYLTEIAEERFNTTEAQLNLLANAFRDLQIEIGNKMLPTIKDAIQIFFVPLFDVLKEISPQILEVTVVFAGLTLGAGALFTALSFLVNPITLIIGALGALSVVFIQNFDSISKSIVAVIPQFQGIVDAIDAIKNAADFDILVALGLKEPDAIDKPLSLASMLQGQFGISTGGIGSSSFTTGFTGNSRVDFLRSLFPEISQADLMNVVLPEFDKINAFTKENVYGIFAGQEVKIPLNLGFDITLPDGETLSTSQMSSFKTMKLLNPEDLLNFGIPNAVATSQGTSSGLLENLRNEFNSLFSDIATLLVEIAGGAYFLSLLVDFGFAKTFFTTIFKALGSVSLSSLVVPVGAVLLITDVVVNEEESALAGVAQDVINAMFSEEKAVNGILTDENGVQVGLDVRFAFDVVETFFSDEFYAAVDKGVDQLLANIGNQFDIFFRSLGLSFQIAVYNALGSFYSDPNVLAILNLIGYRDAEGLGAEMFGKADSLITQKAIIRGELILEQPMVQGAFFGFSQGEGSSLQQSLDNMELGMVGQDLENESYVELGKDILRGIMIGLSNEDELTLIDDNTLSASQRILASFIEHLGIGSPSTITEEYGKWLMEGLAIGITNNLDMVLTPIQMIIDRVNILSQSFANLAISAGINMFLVSVITTTFLNPLALVFDRLTIASQNFEKVLAGIAGTMGLIVNAGVPISTLVGSSIASGNLTAETGGYFGKGSFVEVLENNLPFEAMSIAGRSFMLLNDNASIYSPRGKGEFGLSAPPINNSSSSQSIHIDSLSVGIDGSKNAIDVAEKVVETIRNSAKISNVRKIQQLG